MGETPVLFVVAAVTAGLLFAGAIVSPTTGAWRLLAVALVAATVLVEGFTGSILLGRPQPTTISLAMPAKPWSEILFADWTEGVGIYVLARHARGETPRLYSLPWQRSLAEQLQLAIDEARERNGILRMSNVFRMSEHDLADQVVFTVAAPLPGASDQ